MIEKKKFSKSKYKSIDENIKSEELTNKMIAHARLNNFLTAFVERVIKKQKNL